MRAARFKVGISEVSCDKLVGKRGNYHKPTRQRGIFGHAAEMPQVNPSLVFRVVIVRNSQLQKLPAGLNPQLTDSLKSPLQRFENLGKMRWKAGLKMGRGRMEIAALSRSGEWSCGDEDNC